MKILHNTSNHLYLPGRQYILIRRRELNRDRKIQLIADANVIIINGFILTTALRSRLMLPFRISSCLSLFFTGQCAGETTDLRIYGTGSSTFLTLNTGEATARHRSQFSSCRIIVTTSPMVGLESLSSATHRRAT